MPVSQTMASTAEQRTRSLYEEGARLLAAAWDEDASLVRHETPLGVFHDGRASLAYAIVLLREQSEDSVARAARIIDVVATMQETREDDAHHGNFRWFFEDAGVTDLNAVEFALDSLNAIARDHARALPAASRDRLLDMIALGLEEIERLDVHPSYTNIAISDICNCVLGGEILGDERWVQRGARRLDEWFDFTNRSGAPHEYNSPTYLAVDLMRLAALAEHTADAAIALKARIAEERLWLHVAAHYHPGLAQIAGPHSRSYRDGWTGASGYLKLVLWRLLGNDALRRPTPFFPQGREEAHTGIALETMHCPAYVIDWLRDRPYPHEARETADVARGTDLTVYMTEDYALGTSSRWYDVGEPPEPWPACNSTLLHFRRDDAPGYGTLFARYIVNEKGAGAILHESNRTAEDHWEEGRHAGAQHRNRAIVAYGLVPRTRPAHSFKLSLRMLGVTASTAVYAGDRHIESFPAAIEPGEPVIVADGAVYVAMIPLEPSDMGSGAPIELNVDGGMLTLEIYNYRGPAKTFWEHRSQGGPFFKGTVRNAVIVEVGSRTDFADVDAFREHIAAATIADTVDGELVREIVFANGDDSMTLRYSLRDMRVVERRYNGNFYAPPMARAGAVDGTGPQWSQTRDSVVRIAGATLVKDNTPAWLFADAGRGRYVFVNPTDEATPVFLETPRTIIDCGAFPFGRIDLDEAAGVLTIAAVDELAGLRLRNDSITRVSLNGADITDAFLVIGHRTREFRGVADAP